MRFILLDILEKTNTIDDKDKLAEFLKPNMVYPMNVLLAAYFNDKIEFESFRGLKYKKGKPFEKGLADSNIEVQLRKLYIFRKDYTIIPYEKKKETLIKLLELLSEEEQELFLSALRKKNNYKNITRPFIKRYFPYILNFDIKRV